MLEHSLDRPAQIDRRGARGAERVGARAKFRERIGFPCRQNHPVSSGNSNRRRAAHPHVFDGDCQFVQRAQLVIDDIIRQEALVEHHHRIIFGHQFDRRIARTANRVGMGDCDHVVTARSVLFEKSNENLVDELWIR